MSNKISKEKLNCLNIALENLDILKGAITRIINGETENEVCIDLGINKGSFRNFVSGKSLGYKGSMPEECDSFIAELTPAENLWCHLIGFKYKNSMPNQIEAHMEGLLDVLKEDDSKVLRTCYYECDSLDEYAEKIGVDKEQARKIVNHSLGVARQTRYSHFLFEPDFEEIENNLKKTKEDKRKKLARIESLRDENDIEVLDLSNRVEHALRRSKINTVDELVTNSISDLLKLRCIGKEAINEISNSLLEKCGITLKY